MNNILYSITWLAISLIPPFIVYFVTRKSKGRQTSNKTTKIYLLIFIFAIISSTLIYSLFDTLYLSLIILFILGVLALIYLIHNQNSIKDEHCESKDKEQRGYWQILVPASILIPSDLLAKAPISSIFSLTRFLRTLTHMITGCLRRNWVQPLSVISLAERVPTERGIRFPRKWSPVTE